MNQAWQKDTKWPKTHFVITPSNTVDMPVVCLVYVNGAGDVSLVADDGTAITYTGLTVGTILPIQARRVNATGTTSASLIGIY